MASKVGSITAFDLTKQNLTLFNHQNKFTGPGHQLPHSSLDVTKSHNLAAGDLLIQKSRNNNKLT